MGGGGRNKKTPLHKEKKREACFPRQAAPPHLRGKKPHFPLGFFPLFFGPKKKLPIKTGPPPTPGPGPAVESLLLQRPNPFL